MPHEESAAGELKKRSLTNLYNARPQWLADTHGSLDAAVAAAYGGDRDISEDEVFRELLMLNSAATLARWANGLLDDAKLLAAALPLFHRGANDNSTCSRNWIKAMSQQEKQATTRAEMAKGLAQRGSVMEHAVSGSASRSASPVRISVRATAGKRARIQRAAKISHKSVSEFLLEAGVNAADETLADRRLFKLDNEQWHAFQEVLSRPVARKPRLARLLAEKSVLE